MSQLLTFIKIIYFSYSYIFMFIYMYKHVIKMSQLQIQRIEKISHITCFTACYPLVKREKNMNVY